MTHEAHYYFDDPDLSIEINDEVSFPAEPYDSKGLVKRILPRLRKVEVKEEQMFGFRTTGRPKYKTVRVDIDKIVLIQRDQ